MNGRTQTGIVLLVLGIGFILQQMDIVPFTDLLKHWWPLAIILVGLTELMKKNGKATGLILVIIGGLLLLNQMYEMNMWKYIWPILLVLIGGIFIFTKPNFTRNTLDKGEADINMIAVFSESKHRSQATEFERGTVTTVFGSGEVDLRDAKLEKEIYLDTTTVFGEIKIILPKHVHVVFKGVPIFASFEDKTRQQAQTEESIILHVNAVAVFGSVLVQD